MTGEKGRKTHIRVPSVEGGPINPPRDRKGERMPQEIVEKLAAHLNARGSGSWHDMAASFLAALSPDDLRGLLEHATGKRVVVATEEQVRAMRSAVSFAGYDYFSEPKIVNDLAELFRSALASPRELGQDDG